MRKMSWLGLLLLSLFLFTITSLSAVAENPKHYTELEFTPLPEVQFSDYERYQLDNGMIVYLVEDRDLPLVSGTALVHTGSRFEPADKVGLAELVGRVMRSGGTETHPAEELNLLLEQKAASVETNINTASGSVSFNALSEDLDEVFALFAEVIRQPAFAPEKLALAKQQKAGAIARRNDDPGDIASREFNKLIYGEESPYARTVEYETLSNITREDLVSYYRQYFRPSATILGIVGDFATADMKEAIEQTFGDWQVDTPPPPLEVPTATQKYERGVFLIERPQLTQSNIVLGHLGGKLNNIDYPALSVMNGAINGFGGRLFNEVRSRQGIAYSVYGLWNPSYDYPGVFVAGGQTQTNTTVPFVRAVMSEIERLRNQSITERELSNAKESILNSFVFNFQSPNQTLSRLMRYEYFGYPLDFIFQYQQGVKATKAKDIQRVAQKYLQPEQIVTLVVGNPEAMQPPLSSLETEIQTVDIAIPQPSPS